MKEFTKKLTTVLLVLLMLTQQVPVTRVYAEDNDVTVIEEGTTQANENGSTENTGTGETVSFAEEGDPTVTEGEVVPATNEGTTGTPTEGENGDLPDDPDDPVVKDGEGETSVELITDEKNELHALSIQGPAAMSLELSATAIEENSELNEEEALEAANELFAAPQLRSKEDPLHPRSGDGTDIEGFSISWKTEDTVDNNDPALLYIKPEKDETQMVRLTVRYSLSGSFDYEPETVRIKLPATLFNGRNGEVLGEVSIPYDEWPSTKKEWNWQLVDGYYILTNTRKMDAATKGFFDISFIELVPHTLIDMKEYGPYTASIELVNHAGNVLGLYSDDLYAQFDTEAKVTDAKKSAYSEVNRVPASDIPEELRIEGEDWYIKVDWYVWGNISANTLYDLQTRDFVDGEYSGFVIGANDGIGLAQTNTYNPSYTDGKTKYYYFSTAYPASQFLPDVDYTFTNSVTFTVTEVDPASGNDPQLITDQTAIATKTWRYHDPKWIEPIGHFNVFKNGNDGKDAENRTHHARRIDTYSDHHLWNDGYYEVYGGALNVLQDGDDFDFSYTVNSIGYIMPWTWQIVDPGTEEIPWSRIIGNYFQRPVRMTTADDGMSIGRFAEKLIPLTDYEYVSVEFLDDPKVYTGIPNNINPDGSWQANNYADGTFLYSRDYNKENWPDIDLEVLIDGNWEYYATASWKTGRLIITKADGTTQTNATVNFTEEERSRIENWRTTVTFNNAALDYDVRPLIRVKSSDTVRSIINAEFEKTNTPELQFYNNVTMLAEAWDVNTPYDPELDLWSDIVFFPNEESPYKDGYNKATGYTTDTAVYPYKEGTSAQTDVDYSNEEFTIHYDSRVEIQTFINSTATFYEAIRDGRLTTATHGYWYDLLPKGVVPDISTITVRSGDAVKDIQIYENYNNSDRYLLAVEVDLTPVPERYRVGDVYYYQDVPTISFDATYSFASYDDFGDYLHNVIAFESSDPLGTIDDYRGEPDDPNADPHNNVSTPEAFASEREKSWMTDLDPNSDSNSFVYAGVYNKLDKNDYAQTSLRKEVDVNHEGVYSTGVYYGDESNARTVYVGGDYTYRLRITSSDTTRTEEIIFFDSLENFYSGEGNDPIDIDAPRWNGTLKNVDVSELEEKGCAPVVYYSWISNLQLADESDPTEAHSINTVLSNRNVWLEESEFYAAGYTLEDVKAVAVDARVKQDGSKFVLEPMETAVIYINMKAPSGEEAQDYIAEDAHAYNNAYSLFYSYDMENPEGGNRLWFIHQDYTKVGMEPYEIKVTKIWNDEDDRDGIRPDSIVIHLLANNVDTGRSATLPIEGEDGELIWEVTFDRLTYTDETGKVINYRFTEEPAEGYNWSVIRDSESSYRLINRHIPEKVSVDGEKTWEGDNELERPSRIYVELYADGVKTGKSITVTADSNGDWYYSFDDLYKYKDGKEIVYTVKETVTQTVSSYVQEYDGTNIRNVYHPYGDLYVKKLIANYDVISDTARNKQFTLTFYFTTDDGSIPVMGSFDYEILDETGTPTGTTGTVGYGDSVTIGHGQTVHMKEIDEGVEYEVREEELAGFALTSSDNITGTIKPNTENDVLLNNTYSAEGRINLPANKRLNNHSMKEHQFMFYLYDENDDTIPIKTASNQEPQITYREDGTIEYSWADVRFGALRYYAEDAGKTFTYTMKEYIMDKDGYVYDDTVYTVKVSVTDNGDGTLTATPTYYLNDEQIEEIVFVNEYEAEGEVELIAWKTLNGRILEDDEFTFELLNEDGSEVLDTKKNKGGSTTGTITFDKIKYDQTDIGKDYFYLVREVKGDDGSVRYNSGYFAYKVTVGDYSNGRLKVSYTFVALNVTVDEDGNTVKVVYPTEEKEILDDEGNVIGTEIVNKEGELPEFINTLTDGGLKVVKYISEDSEDYDPDQEFVFRVKLTDFSGDSVDYDVADVSDLTNSTSASASVEDGWITIVLHGGEMAVIDDLPAGMSYLVVEDTPDGWILVAEENVSGFIEPLTYATAAFTNKYQPDFALARFYGTKMLDNRVAEDHEFFFELLDEDGKQLQLKWNVSGGFILFDPIQYSKAEIGVHTYTIREVYTGNDTVEYDTHEETVTVTVTEDSNGVLSAKVEYDDDEVSFVNRKKPGILRITKVGEGVDDSNKDDEFTFRVTLTNAYGMPLGEGEKIYWYVDSDTIVGRAQKAVETVLNNVKIMAEEENVSSGGKVEVLPLRSDPTSFNIRAGINQPAKETNNTFHATDDMLEGNAYAVLTDDGELIFLRSETGPGDGSITDIRGVTHTGKIYTVDETAQPYMTNDIPWYADRGSITSVKVADGQAIKPVSMRLWFNACSKLASVDLNGFDTSVTTNMDSTFANCSSLTSIDLTSLDMSSVTTTASMFENCTYMISIDMSNMDLSKVQNMREMFMNLARVQTIDLSGTVARDVTSMHEMFSNCYALQGLDLSGFRSPNLTDMTHMFFACEHLATLDISKLSTSKVTDMSELFERCKVLRNLDLSNFDTSNVTNMSEMFSECGVINLNVSSFDTSKVTNMSKMFASTALRNLDISNFVTSNVTTFNSMFSESQSLQSIKMDKLTTESATDLGAMFSGCWNLGSIDVSKFKTDQVTNMNRMFQACMRLVFLDLSNFVVSEGTDVGNMFLNDSRLYEVVLGEGFSFNESALLPGNAWGIWTGNWIKKDKTDGPYSPEYLRDNYDGASMNGSWIREVRENSSFIMYSGNGGYINTNGVTVTSLGQQITMPDGTTVTRPGYALVGWSEEADAETAQFEAGKTYSYSDIDSELGNLIILYAVWERGETRTYTVNHYVMRGDLSGYSLRETERCWVNVYGSEEELETIVATVTPRVKEYQEYIIPEPQTITIAHGETKVVSYYYDLAKYIIRFDGNGATSGQMRDLNVFMASPQQLTMNNFLKTGSIFIGWNTEPDGSGTSYADGQTVRYLTTVHNEVITLYAQWKLNENEPASVTSGVIYVTCKAGETIVIPGLPDGTTYTVEEIDIPDGWQFVSIDNGSGSIASNQTVTVTAVNENIREPEETGLRLYAYKMLQGAEVEEGQFTFIVESKDDGVICTGTNGEPDMNEYLLDDEGYEILDEDGNPIRNPWYGYALVEFGLIPYTEDDIGKTFSYNVHEVISDEPGIKYDTTSYRVEVTVTRNAETGKLETEAIYYKNGRTAEDIVFTNKLQPGKLKIQKDVVDNGDVNDQFSFQVNFETPDGTDPISTLSYSTMVMGEKHVFHSSNFTDDGTRTGDIQEGESGGTEYELSSMYTHIKVTCGDDITVSIAGRSFYAGPGEVKTFEFDYDYPKFEAYAWAEGHEQGYGWFVEVTEMEMDYSIYYAGVPITIAGGETVVFDELPAGTKYSVSEIDVPQYWTLIDTVNSEGTIGPAQTAEVVFTNRYEYIPQEISVQLQAYKTIENGEIREGDEFYFELQDENGDAIQRKTVDDRSDDEHSVTTSTITFDPLNFGEEDVGTYTYYVHEIIGDAKGVEYDTTQYEAVVEIFMEEGTILRSKVTYRKPKEDGKYEEVDRIEFINKKFVDLEIEKELDSWETGSPVTFVFDVVAKVDDGVVYANVHSMTFTGPGSQKIKIENLPEGATVTVTEIYAGAGYTVSGDAQFTVELANERKVKFKNTYDRKKKRGYGAQNTFTREDGGTWTWENDLEEGGE